ncbi:putative non-specific serine/threonine protein kinase [Helianthus annuus]|uniref:Non-specific serine/threonine protein kinase n=1 Tax=Helianthus annuus TaxID=4232 RepID=A0A9K3ICW8_HELAN|nr:receptor-like protein EIX2 [Helianthus annuus]KAF5794251.1 putative non-specific serine/threonine protein kinase [Helianthus annuus]KAJ0537949.1 putative non-specific serine/threonine protein kinase [Helianthus annuus]KAJ0545658.1 putative non-specific serine/threonine protein kinase [Helianthus annuus]KAJ0552535.1 putative non-specific serine/threonine protein kinase [Helianthus annuus]KAJ0718232.1 putative non-specific serine/threonine protein kinase [Helianthus annuus]
METRFLLIFTFLFFQTFGLSIITTSSNVICIASERQSLLIFKQTLKDKNNLLSTWHGVECCEWHGVLCDNQDGHVVKLDLRGQASLDKCLKGELSPSLQNLKHLRYLDVSMNDFSGSIPEFLGSFQCLEYLNLSGSFYSKAVPHHLGNLSRLQYLDLSNYIDGFIFPGPIMDDITWVSSLSSLRYLDLSGITIGSHIDWFHPIINMLPSLHTLKLAFTFISIPSIKFINFTSLYSLDLSMNGINSTIPISLANLTSLMHLNLNHNQFHGKIPDFNGMFSSLASIDLSFNSFNTPMPDVLCNLSSLVHLDLSRNMFTGPIPAKIGLLLRLEDLYLQNNQLSGNIPVSLGQLSKLKNLDLSHNSLVGVLTESHLAKLNSLNSLVLSYNSLPLNFSNGWIAPFKLQAFLASSCNIGPYFPKWLQTQTNLQRLDLSNSSIKDTMPEWFENILSHILYLDLSNNQISGKLPRFHFHSSNDIEDGILKMNSNKFDGSLATFPSNVKILDLSDNLLSGHLPQTDGTMNPSLQVVNLSNNRFIGTIPIHLCKVPSIILLDLSQNKFSGRLPGCIGNLTNLSVIDLTNNNMTGVVPSSLGCLKLLRSLHLHNNKFEGDIPSSFQNLTKLVTMDLGNNLFTGTIPFWIGEKLSKLRILNLQSNKFTGKIPRQICQLNVLQLLSIAHNSITGTIPDCLGNLSGMMITNSEDEFAHFYYMSDYEENILSYMKGRELHYTKIILYLVASLDLSSNNIVGEIPDALMNLVGLKSLNLSGNLLKGQIPMLIGDLDQLESLDLSMNNFSGRIPHSLTSLNFLSHLNLSFNNLSGTIPNGNQLQTLDDPSIYEGNNGLCGPPLLRSCNRNDVTDNHVGEDEGQDGTEGLWIYVGMGPGFVVGFMGLLGSLHFIRRWRVAYFETLGNIYGWITLLFALNLARLRRNVFE